MQTSKIKRLRTFKYGYLVPMVILGLLYRFVQLNKIDNVWLALVVALPTFGYMYLKSAQVTETLFYVHVMHRWFKWDTVRFYKRWNGFLIVPVLTLMGYGLGVMFAVTQGFILMILTVITCGFCVRKGFN